MAFTLPVEERSKEADGPARELGAAAPRMLAVATLILGNTRDAEDAVQDAMLSAWRRWDQLRRQWSARGVAHADLRSPKPSQCPTASHT